MNSQKSIEANNTVSWGTLPPWLQEHTSTMYAFLQTLEVTQDMIKDKEMMHTAFIHKSYAADYSGDYVYNERLEFLGDAILSAIVAKLLYIDFPNHAESDLTLYKIALVRAESLAAVAQDIGLDKVILLGKWEEKNNWRAKITVLCDCLEALLWFLYLDCGADIVENIVKKYILSKLSQETELSVKSYKSHLQELVQKLHKVTPHYIETEYWKDPETHELLYESRVYMWEQLLWSWLWTNKKKAQEQAAKNGYELWQNQNTAP